MLQILLVGLKNTSDSGDLWHGCVAVERETVVDSGLAKRDAAEAESGKHLGTVIRLQNGTHLLDGCVVLVLGPHIVQRLSILRVPIRRCEVNGHSERDLPAAS